jgi:cell wall-associated NlpC family hydrolase
MLPLAGAETSSKKKSSTSSASATPKKKTGATPSSKSSGEKKSTSASPSPTGATPNKKSGTAASSTKKSSETPDAEPTPESKESEGAGTSKSTGDGSTEEKESGTAAKATPKPKTSTGKKKTSAGTAAKKEIPGQPTPELPKGEEPKSGESKSSESKNGEFKSREPKSEEKSAEDKPEQSQANGSLTTNGKNGKAAAAPNVSISTDELLGFGDQPPRVQKLIDSALQLARQNLTYTYGSADPAQGGMDCSGAIYYLLRQHGFTDVPRDASGQYVWARKNGKFYAVISKKADSFEFGDLLPGDLLFWSGTYNVDRDPPVTHSMIYLGVQKKRGQHVMWGSSDGRSYDGKARWGVSVFDF